MRRPRHLGLFVALFVIPSVVAATWDEESSARKPVPERMKVGFDSITANDSYSYLEFIAADELEGRDTATRGLAIARKYIESLYKTWNIEPAGDEKGELRSYGQRIDMVEVRIGDETRIEVESGTQVYRFGWQSDFSGGMGLEVPGLLDAPAVFAGYGLSAPDLGYDDFAAIDVRNKIVVTSFGKPGADREDSPFNLPENRARFAGRYTPAEKCARLLASKGALALLIVDESVGRADNAGGYRHGSRIRSSRRPLVAPKLSAAIPRVPAFWVSPGVADGLFSQSGKTFADVKSEIDAQLKPRSMDLPQTNVKLYLDVRRDNTVSANVLGLIEGSDPQLKDEFIVIGAHLDHVGMNEDGYVFNGADDNGSGSVGVLQIAKAFSLNSVKPKRTLLFAHWTGEEKGLVGSRYFVNYPTVDFPKVIACINLDMICKNTSLETIRAENKDFDISEEILSRYSDEPEQLLTAYTSSPSPDIARYSVDIARDHLGLIVVPLSSFPMIGNSDHYPFAEKHVPSVFFNTQGHQDLHQPGDTVEKINAEKMSEIVKLAYLMAFTVADADQRPGWSSSQ